MRLGPHQHNGRTYRVHVEHGYVVLTEDGRRQWQGNARRLSRVTEVPPEVRDHFFDALVKKGVTS